MTTKLHLSGRYLAITFVTLFSAACSGTGSGDGEGTPAGSSGASGGATPASSGGVSQTGGASSIGGSSASGASGGSASPQGGGGSAAAGGSGGPGAPAAGGGGTAGGAGAGGSVAPQGGSGPLQSCADPTPKGSFDVPNVGTAPGAITEVSSSVAHYLQSLPGGLSAAGTTDPAKQVGLFVTFHEHAQTSRDEITSVNKALTELKRAGDFVVLGVEAETHDGYTTADQTRTKNLIEYALKTWPINPRRVYLWGRGAGATVVHQYATQNKGTIAAMITYSWGMERWPTNSANDYPDLYLVIGLADYPDSHVPLVRRVYQAAKKAMFNIIYREVPGLKGPTANAITNTDAVSWAINSRHKTLPLSTPEEALVRPYRDASAAAGICPDGALFSALERVGGTEVGKVLPGVLNAGTEASRVLGAELGGRANLGNEADTALAGKLTDPSAAVRKEVIAALGRAANWRNQAAQKALIDFVTNPAGNAAERALAIDAIGVAVKYQIGGAVDTGAYQDPPLFQALITLLSDSDLNLRTKAFSVLKPAMASTYDPAAAPSSQQVAISAWQSWLATLKG